MSAGAAPEFAFAPPAFQGLLREESMPVLRPSEPQRLPLHLPGAGGAALFGWLHSDASARQRDCVAVICNPIGHEYVHSHRSLRHLADGLARAGVPALRFDYRGTGDSSGSDLDPGRWPAWQADVLGAVRHARERTGRKGVCLIGLRLGAALAATLCKEVDVDLLVLWAPVVSGRRYLREWQAMASASGRASATDGTLEGGGFVLSAETMEAIRGVDLLAQKAWRVSRRALILGREETAIDSPLGEHLTAQGIALDSLGAPGFEAMMAEPQHTEVPRLALGHMVDWVVSHSEPERAAPWNQGGEASGRVEGLQAEAASSVEREELCRFGPERRLFGVLCRSAQASDCAVLMLNAGSVHHIGPNRVYVTLARALAARGRHSLRFDLASIGDSVAPPGAPENHPYPPTAARDVRAALDFLARRGYRNFIVLGLCSGAHTAFHAALDFPERDIRQVILINPLTFHWKEGMSLDVSGKAQAASYYKGVLRDPSRWPALLHRKIPWAKAAALARTQAAALWKSHYGQAREWLLPAARSELSRDLQRLYGLRRPLDLVLAEGDPGLDLMMANARRATAKGLKSGAIRLKVIGGADHTFSRAAPRAELIDYLCGLLALR